MLPVWCLQSHKRVIRQNQPRACRPQMTVPVSAFFPEEPPPSAEPPADAGLASRVEKLADFASRNGPSFVALMQQKQQDNPEFAFLSPGGDGSE